MVKGKRQKMRRTCSALQGDAERRPIWITPCKPQAQLGVETVLSLPELRSSSTHYRRINNKL
jgi:hypothetical protein